MTISQHFLEDLVGCVRSEELTCGLVKCFSGQSMCLENVRAGIWSFKGKSQASLAANHNTREAETRDPQHRLAWQHRLKMDELWIQSEKKQNLKK